MTLLEDSIREWCEVYDWHLTTAEPAIEYRHGVSPRQRRMVATLYAILHDPTALPIHRSIAYSALRSQRDQLCACPGASW